MTQNYTPEFEAQIQVWAEQQIPEKRLPHVRGVVEMVDHLAQLYAPNDVLLVRLAGWLHDSAKALSDADLLAQANAFQLPISEMEQTVPMLLHGAVGYALANEVFDLNDPRLASACNLHTTGAPGMSITDKIVMLGDAIEPTRKYPGVDELRVLAEENLDRAVLQLATNTINHLEKRGRAIDPRVIDLRDELIQQLANEES